ncbi:MAG: hypothetical protein ACR2QH_04685 [Geminicoccaceae bacterium]
MRKLLTAGAASVAFFSTAQAMAADSVVSYDIQSTCEVSQLQPTVERLVTSLANATGGNQGSGFRLVCDDPNGATLTLATTNGGLLNADDPSVLLNYSVEAIGGPGQDIAQTFLTTDGTPGGSVSQTLAANEDLANGVGIGNMIFRVYWPSSFPFAGAYTDTVSVNVTGNP